MVNRPGGGHRINNNRMALSTLFILILFFILIPKASYAAGLLHDLEPGSLINFSGKDWMILDQKDDGTTYIILNSNDGDRVFHTYVSGQNNQVFNPGNSNNIGYYLNNGFYNSLTDKDFIEQHIWDRKFENGVQTYIDILANIALISCSEYNIYRSLFPSEGTGYGWWTRTPRYNANNNVNLINTNGNIGYIYSHSTQGIRPTLYLKSGLVLSDTGVVMTSPPIDAPIGLNADPVSYYQVQLYWQANTEPDLAGYIIYRDYIEIDRVGATETSYQEENLNPGTTYIYGIKAYNTYGLISDISNAATVTTLLPPAPAGLTVNNVAPTSADVTWDEVSGAYSYNIYLDGSPIYNTTQTEYGITGLLPDTSHIIEVRTVISDVESNPGESTVTFNTLLPPAPTGLTVNELTSTSAYVTWDAVFGAYSYNIYFDGSPIYNTTQTQYGITDLLPGTNHVIDVRTVINGVESDPATVSFKTIPMTATPTGLTANPLTYDQVQLNWNPNTEDELAGYIIYRDYIEINRVGATETSYIDSGLNPNTAYVYGIKSYSTSFVSDISNAVTVTTPTYNIIKTPSAFVMARDLTAATSEVIYPIGGLLALGLGIKLYPWLVLIAKTIFIR